MGAIVAKPYGLDKLKKDNNFLKVRLLEKKLFLEFCELYAKIINNPASELKKILLSE